MIFRKIGCLVVTSNSVKLKSISSWPNFRAKTTKNHFRFHFHFKWLPALENRRERERERERQRERERERERGRKKEEIATSSAPRRPPTSSASQTARCRHHRHRERVDHANCDCADRDLADRDLADCDLAFVCPNLMIFSWVLFVFWGMNDIIYSFGDQENVRKCVFYGIFKNTNKHQKIFSETFFEMQPNTWKHFPFRKIAFSENIYFPEILLHEPNAGLAV